VNPANVQRSFNAIVKAARLPDGSPLRRIRVHDIRHTSATLLLLGGTPAKIVSERLGHASIGITLDLYSHVLPDMQQDAASAMDAIIDGALG
jgi:integrase